MGFSLQSFTHILQRLSMQLFSVIAPRQAMAKAAALFITPPRFAHSAAEQRLLATARLKTVTTRFGKITTWRIGESHHPAIVFSHGWGGRGAQFRAFVPSLVAAGYQVVLFDHFGHGMSDNREATLVDFWRGVEAVWDDLLDDGIHVQGMVAHSLGGAAVASSMRRNLTRMNKVTNNPRVVLIAPPSSLIRYSRLFARYIGIPERIRRAMQWRFEQRTGVAWDEFELPHSVNAIDAPALFIHDKEDRETSFSGGIALAEAWPDARMLPTTGLGHRRILRDKNVIQSTLSFLQNTTEFSRPCVAPLVAPLY
jgi:pimeloyl-ACP methyl ester carboxylesterase